MGIFDSIFSWSKEFIYGILPLDPFKDFITAMDTKSVQQGLAWLNWFIPIVDFIKITKAWLICLISYYVFSAVLRWLNIIE